MSKISPEAGDYKVQFDTKKGSSYLCCSGSCLLCTTVIGIPCIPCCPLFSKWSVESQDCTVEEHRIHFKNGWFNKEDKLIPLDRIQDVNIGRNFIQRIFGVAQIDIQTAGNSGANQTGAEASLIAPLDPEGVRREIMSRRDHLVLGHGVVGGGVDSLKPVTSQPAALTMDIVNELKKIKNLVKNIEEKVPKK
ncbi:hypothetical protein HDV06_002501 [Boothiomyces sp. JEL0866]|nr:hypothetical protein HDV06_002501 [Boothiomyces sp. JEL0866]